ncbi:phospholipase D-like domain-containing protein [Alkalibacillus aidingensis]|uniref:phospholipase D-like domain-containing protein n=1 Tax=Alkalibacillus aidingensis TaxID=2747607 RepID=UPI0016614AFE|nr:phospholipase D-like domain-containing protein [Alkalibacillus aidingensis]
MWVLIVIAIIIIFFLIYNHQSNSKTPELFKYPIRKSDLKLFWNGKDLFNQLFEDIRKAEEFVCISFFIVRDDRFGDEFLTLLKEKADSGVPVYLLLDRIGSRSLKGRKDELRQAGIHLTFSNRINLMKPIASMNKRNHRKLTVIDGEIAYIGGFNVADEYVNESPKFSLWRDYHLRLTGEVVEDAQNLFTLDWEFSSKYPIKLTQKEHPPGTVKCQLVPTAQGSLEENMINLISQAKQSICIGSPYFIPSNKVFNLLLDKANQGVQITILYPHQSDHPLVKEASIPYLKKMQDVGANVQLFTNGFYHAKVIIIDDHIADVGTANFDRRSIFLSDELNVLIHNPVFIRTIYSIYSVDLKDSIPLYDQWMNTPNRLVMFFKKQVAYAFRGLL